MSIEKQEQKKTGLSALVEDKLKDYFTNLVSIYVVKF